MADRLVIIDGATVGRCTNVKITDNINMSTTDTFDGVVSNGQAKTSYEVEIQKLVAPNVESYLELRNIIQDMKTNKKEVTIKETVRGNDDTTYTISQIYLRCLTSDYSKELDVGSLTTETLKVTAEDMVESAKRD